MSPILAPDSRAVARAQGHAYLVFFQMALGMAEYRTGHYAAAEAALRAASQAGAGRSWVTGTCAFYRAMSLFQQGKETEARRLMAEATSRRKPLPANAKKPLGDRDGPDDLIMWLAFKEARALIPVVAVPPP
jgi:hypothetical protein